MFSVRVCLGPGVGNSAFWGFVSSATIEMLSAGNRAKGANWSLDPAGGHR